MSGHSKWANIKRKKEKTDGQRAKIFTKIGREITVAAREGGPDPNNNSRLATLIAKAKANNVPNDNIERLLKKAGEGKEDYEEITYEGYGPSGVVEEKRPGQYFPIVEDTHGSYILNADDLCMIGHLDRLAEAGVTSFKIEGRAKSAYYTACVTAAYRAALDAYLAASGAYSPPSWALDEVDKVSHRNYSTGFYFGTPGQNCETNGYVRGWDVIASVEGWAGGRLTVQERNVFSRGEQAELLVPRQAPRPLHIEEIFDVELGAPVERACHPMRRYELPCAGPVPPGSMLRRRAAQE